MSNIIHLKDKRISDAFAEYQDAIENSTISNRTSLLKYIFQGGNCDGEMLFLIHSFVKKCVISEKDLIYSSISQICGTKTTFEESELVWLVKIVFIALELLKKNDEKEKQKIYLAIHTILDEIRKNNLDAVFEQFLNHLVIFLGSADASDSCISIFNNFLKFENHDSREALFDTPHGTSEMTARCIDVVLESIQSDNNPVFLKNCSNLMSEMAARCSEIFLNRDLKDHDTHFIRNANLEVYFHIILLLKASNDQAIESKIKKGDNISQISGKNSASSLFTLMNEYLDLILERLLDINHFVRSKALSILTHLLSRHAILITNRERVISLVIERLRDKSVLVRKKVIQFCQSAIENHPFASNKFLMKIDDPKKLSIEMTNKQDEDLALKRDAYVKELNIFVEQMSSVLVTIMNIFPALRTETVDIIEFSRTCVLLKLPQSLKFINFLCKNTDKKHKSVFMEILIEMIQGLRDYDDLIDLLISIDEPFLKTLSKRHIIEKKFLKSLMKQFENKSNIVKSSLLLKRICIKRYNGNYFELAIKYVKESESPTTLNAYKNILDIVKLKPSESIRKKRLSVQKDFKGDTEEPSDFEKAIDVLVCTKIVDFDLIDSTIRLIYRTADPHRYVKTLLTRFVDSQSITKLVYCIGSVALNEAFFIDKMEKNIPAIMVPDEIKERRRSFNASRTSFRNSINESFNNRNSFVYGDEDLNDSYIQPVTIIQSQTGLENKTDDEIKDILFYIKEKEIFYGKNSLLAPFIKLVLKNTEGPLQVPAMISTFRMMAVSSEFFLKNHHVFINGLRSKNYTVVYNSIIALADYILLYNCYTERYTSMLFDKLFVSDDSHENDPSQNTQENASETCQISKSTITPDDIINLTLFVINYLISSKILKIKGYGSILCRLYDTHTEELKSILQEIKTDENAISSLFYEVLLEEMNALENDKNTTNKKISLSNVVHFLRDLVKEKTKENLFVRILRKYYQDEKYGPLMNTLYKTLSFNPKNVSNMRVDAVFGKWIEVK